MKTLILCITTITLSLLFSEASAQYWKTNGNLVGPTDFLGSTNNQDLRFKVANFPRMRIMSNGGFVGLGDYTAFTPDAFLHINQPSQNIPNGKLIRTDGFASLVLSWSMYSSMSGGSLEQRARFLLSPNTPTQVYNDDNPEHSKRIRKPPGR